MRRIIWIAGLASGILIGSNFFLSENLSGPNYDSMELRGYLSMFIIFALSLFLGVRQVDKSKYDGHIKFSQAFVASLYIVLIASIVYTLMWEIYFQNNGDAFVDGFIDNVEKTLRNSDLDADTIESRLAAQSQVMESYRESLMVRFSLTMTEIFPIGLLMSLLNGGLQSFIARKKESKA